MGHLPAPPGDRLEGIGEGEGACRLERAVFAEAVPHHHVRMDAVRGEEPGQRRIHGEHRGLGDLGLP